MSGAAILIAATPVAGLRDLLNRLRGGKIPLVWLCKGFEQDSAALPHEIVAVAGMRAPSGALSGPCPSFALEVARGLPCALTLASADTAFAAQAAAELHGGRLRVYRSDDVVGVEIGGAVKNVLAIAVGICDGLGLGQNARAALGHARAGGIVPPGRSARWARGNGDGPDRRGRSHPHGDGDLSRNRRVGLELARGRPLAGIVADLGHVAEGVSSARATLARAKSCGVEMPITAGGGRSAGEPNHAAAGGGAVARARSKKRGLADSSCRQASNTVTATALDRFRLRLPVRIGRRRRISGLNASSISFGKPAVSDPNTNASFS